MYPASPTNAPRSLPRWLAVLAALCAAACGPVTLAPDGAMVTSDARNPPANDSATPPRSDASTPGLDASPPPPDAEPTPDAASPLDVPPATDAPVVPGPDAPPPAAGFPAPFDRGAVYTSTVYVSPGGNDGAAGTMAAPYRTLARALMSAPAGRRVVMLPGVYPPQGSFSGLRGTAANPIKIEGMGSVAIDVAGGMFAMHVRAPRYLVIENIEVRNSAIHGMNIDDAGSAATPGQYVVLRNVRFRMIGSGGNNDCLKMSGIDNFYIERSEFAGCNMGEAIDMVGCHQGVIASSHFHDMPGTAVQTKGGSADVLVHGNRFANIGAHAINLGGSTDPMLVRPITAPYEGQRIWAVANVIEGSGFAPLNFQGCGECVAAHNTIVRPGRWVVRILPGSRDGTMIPCRNGRFWNNIVSFPAASLSTYVNVGPMTEPGTFDFGWNLWFASDRASFTGPTYTGVPAEHDSVIQQDPRFVNAAASDYHLQASSPAARRGAAMPGITVFDHAARAPTSPPTIGAFNP